MKDFFKKISVRLVCVWCALMVVFLLAYVSCVLPTRNHARRLALLLSDGQSELNKAMHYANHENVQSLMNNAKADKDRLLQFVTETDVATDCSFIVSKIAEQMNISDFTSRYHTGKARAPIPNCKHISMTRMNLSWRGSFADFLHLINRLERHSPVVFVDSFSLMPVKDKSGLHEIDIYLLMLIRDVAEKSSQNEGLETVSKAK